MSLELTEASPVWLCNLIREIGELIRPLGFIGQLGFRYLAPGAAGNTTQRWLVGVYLVPTELSGGSRDGAMLIPGFDISMLLLVKLFSEVTTLEWHVSRGYTGGFSGPEVWLEGVYRGTESVQLHIYADCPSDEFPALVLDASTNKFRAK